MPRRVGGRGINPFYSLQLPIYIVEPIVVPHVDDVVVPLPIIICWRRFGITDRSRRARPTVMAGGRHNSHVIWAMTHTTTEETFMDKDRIKGSAEQAKGAVKEAAGKFSAIPIWKAKARLSRRKARSRMPSAA
jgi:hypothetical protein